MTRVGLILAVATRVEINHWTRRHQGRREITRVRVAAAGLYILADALLDGESALLDEKLLVEAFAHLGDLFLLGLCKSAYTSHYSGLRLVRVRR